MSAANANIVFLSIDSISFPEINAIWAELREEASAVLREDATLGRVMNSAVLFHESFAHALSRRIALKLANHDLDQDELLALTHRAYLDDPGLLLAAVADLQAVRARDPSNSEILTPFLHFKGFIALQSYRIAHWLWLKRRPHLARHIQSRISEVFAIDIHPAAAMGRGIMLDHGNGLVIGETAVVEDDVSILQDVTLGGTGKETGDRHPKIRRGVLIGAGAKILGNIEVGVGAKIGAGSVVVSAVEDHTSVVGVPARPVGRKHDTLPGLTMDQGFDEPEYMI